MWTISVLTRCDASAPPACASGMRGVANSRRAHRYDLNPLTRVLASDALDHHSKSSMSRSTW